MTAALIALALAQTLTVGAFVWLLHRSQDRMWRELQILLNRVQAPETAIAQTVALEQPELGPPDTEATELREFERLQEQFTDG